ncbi:uncharacterized protein BP5553_02106 [Venustampulla echinocandica]|uniref:Uncharacterized protein n=1 Tax=Venustampulla echinocandica TaxID=2656787 RepID=A0A370U2W7_9HELO|nr:uncharacterized protein BP5553_02106 [Venustampulla echinocandica]RDL42127.1 hypothetical protein BP5553_02106 [Venustampulla echinocandica]
MYISSEVRVVGTAENPDTMTCYEILSSLVDDWDDERASTFMRHILVVAKARACKQAIHVGGGLDAQIEAHYGETAWKGLKGPKRRP